MAPNAPSAAPEASSEVLDAARTEAASKPADAALQAIEQQKQSTVVNTATKTETLSQELLDQATAPGATPETVAAAAAADAAKKTGGWGILSGFSEFFTKIGGTFGDIGKKFGDWLGKLMGTKPKKEGQPSSEADSTVSAADEPEISTEMPDEDLLTPEDATGLLTVKSWDEVSALSDLPTRVLQAALYANATDMDCFTSDGNHCSGWCDSVFEKAGLNVYDDKSRIYVGQPEYSEKWGARGTLSGLKLMPGDSVLYHNEGGTNDHQDIVLSSEGPDEAGNYKVTNLGQLKAAGTGGERAVRTMTIKAEDIYVVIRPGATQPFEGDGSDLVS